MVVISPHLDDAVFGCGTALAAHPGSTVVTVFGALPADPGIRTEWDELCGFAGAGQAMQARRREDAAALALLDARPCWLSFADSQYGSAAGAAEIAAALRGVLASLRATVVAFPLGLFHADHLLVHVAAVRALHGLPGIEAFAYEDAIYRAMPQVLERRFASLAAAGTRWQAATLAGERGDLDLKARAVRCYASQAAALGAERMADTGRPERYWRLDG